MSVRAYTEDAAGLLTRIKALIDGGHITTWSYDSDGDFTHTPAQWKNKAYLRPEEKSDCLRFCFVNTQTSPTREIFAVYQGRFIEMLVAHVPKRFTQAIATSNPVTDEPTLSQ